MRKRGVSKDDAQRRSHAGRIARDGFRDFEIAAVLADADAVVAQQLPSGGVFIDDVGEVALLEAVADLPGIVEHTDVGSRALGLKSLGVQDPPALHRARVSASQMPPPIMKPPETRDSSRVRRAEKNRRARPASTA